MLVQLQDDNAQGIIRALEHQQADPDIGAHFAVKDGRLYRKTTLSDRLYVPAIAKFNILRKRHDEIGHHGFERCLSLIGETFGSPRCFGSPR